MATINITAAAFARLLERAAVEMAKPPELDGHFRDAMIRACVLVQTDAITRIGEYQAAIGPFEAWPELADATKRDRVRRGFSEDEPLYRTGEMMRSIQFTIVGTTGYVGTDDPVAEYQELGTSRIPPRSFLGAAGFANEFTIHKLFVRATLRTLGWIR